MGTPLTKRAAFIMAIGSAGVVALAACSGPLEAAASQAPASAAAVAPAASTTGIAADSSPSLITAQGVGKVTGTPDVVTIGLGVDTRSTSAQTALEENNKLAADAIAVLKANGVAPKDLQTSDLSVNPTYDSKGVSITGYQVTNMVTAKLRDIPKAGALIDAVAKSAGNAIRVQQLSFSIDDDSALRAGARADAVKRAAAQAKQMADAAGVRLGPIHSITESPAQQSPISYDMAVPAASAAASVPVESGSLDLSVAVEVVYEIAQ